MNEPKESITKNPLNIGSNWKIFLNIKNCEIIKTNRTKYPIIMWAFFFMNGPIRSKAKTDSDKNISGRIIKILPKILKLDIKL